MARTYAIQKGDTFREIAEKFYGDAGLYRRLAEYNGVRNVDLISLGQVLEIPARSDLEPRRESALKPESAFPPPNGLSEILATFGNIYDFIGDDGNLDPRWEIDYLTRAPLPFPIPLSWDRTKQVRTLHCHRRLADVFGASFGAIAKRGLEGKIETFGGCFNFRSKRTSAKLSAHSWGIAIDLNPETNPQGKSGAMERAVVEVFQEFGFKWGGDWSGRSKDPMHFQYCVGY